MPGLNLNEVIKNCQVFSTLDSAMLGRVSEIVRVKNFGVKETIFSEGDPCHGFYLMVEGAAKIYKLSADGKEHVLHLVWPSDTFAEASLFLGGSYPAYAEAIRPTKALLFPKDAFLEVLRRDPQIALRLLGGMALWLRRLVSQVEVLALRDSGARLAQYLADLEQDGSVSLQAPKAVVASHLGMTPETLSRLFFKFEGLGAIKVKGRTIAVRDRDLLRTIASGVTAV